MMRWVLAAGVSAVFTILVVVPIFLRIDLIPVRVLAHPAFSANAMTLSYVVPLFDAVLVWLWATWALWRVGGWWARRRAAKAAGEPAPVRRSGWIARAAFYALALVTVIPVLLGAMTLPTDVQAGFGVSYRRACGSCHPAERALSFLRSPEAWALTIERHRYYAPERFDDADVEAALDYLVAKRSLSGADLFRVKCLSCHREGAIHEARSPVDWERIVDRLSRYNPFYISPMEKRDLVDYLVSGWLTRKVHRDEEELSRRTVFEEGCGRCHTLGVILTEGIADEAWPGILERMANKVPGLMHEEEARALADWIIAWREDPEAFARAFPHHGAELFFKEVYD
jgi:hypothetical protein